MLGGMEGGIWVAEDCRASWTPEEILRWLKNISKCLVLLPGSERLGSLLGADNHESYKTATRHVAVTDEAMTATHRHLLICCLLAFTFTYFQQDI